MRLSFVWKICKQIFIFAFTIIGTIWSAMEIITGIFADWQLGWDLATNVWVYVVPAIGGGAFRLIYLLKNEVFPSHKFDDKLITVRAGNILKKKKGNIIVGINKSMETSEDLIASGSIHMQLLKENENNAVEMEQIFERHRQGNDPDELFFQGEVNGKDIIFLVMSDLSGAQTAATSKSQVEEGLQELFSHQHVVHITNGTVYCPVLGTGQAGLSLTMHDTVILIVKNFLNYCRCRGVEDADKIKRLKIIVYTKQMLCIDWIALNKEIGFMIERCKLCEGLGLK